ncbi:MAG: hypothetical protein IIX68_01420 [Clostridia bacterium]|nr:hypothetical protein [Clostridia bacterium]
MRIYKMTATFGKLEQATLELNPELILQATLSLAQGGGVVLLTRTGHKQQNLAQQQQNRQRDQNIIRHHTLPPFRFDYNTSHQASQRFSDRPCK